ncbi:MAG: DNA/RNA nuclease SfsA, partial [Lachnospiraceae bacterium]|nr:DNA/RNA nuclease SfsA [Lachnospiraceae bacterium]
MKYSQITEGRFLERPNRFIAYVEIPGISAREKVHVKNTGRCRELLVPGARVYLEKSTNPERSTAYDLVAVMKGDRLVNMDSQAPNKAVGKWLAQGGLGENISLIKPEMTWGNSRFDFYVEFGGEDFQRSSGKDETSVSELRKAFIEVKGVNLEDNGIVRFPDAPSERAVK